MKRLLGSLVCLGMFAGCGSDPVDAEGTYSVGITNRDNACGFDNWTVGAQTSGIEVVITQNGESAVAEVKGAAGAFLQLWIGNATFSGEVAGNHLDMTIQGTRSQTTGNCTFTYDVAFAANLVGDSLNGTISYTAAHNGHTDCAAVECVSSQDFSGSRPPR